MSDSTVDTCLHCAITVQGQCYKLADLGPELLDFVEKSHTCMDISKEILCERCFSVFLNQLKTKHKKAEYSHCHVCQGSIQQKRSHTLPSGPERNELAARIYPRVIPNDGLICFNCWSYARRKVRESGVSTSGSHLEHPKCIDCEHSLSNKPFQVLMDGPEKDIIAIKILPRQIPEITRICRSCWKQVRRTVTSGAREIEYVTNQSSASSNVSVVLAEHTQEACCVWCRESLNERRSHSLIEASAVRDEIEGRIFPREVEFNSRACHACWVAAYRNIQRQGLPVDSTRWTLQNFKRAADSTSYCFVPGCINTERLRIPEYLRNKLFLEYKIFTTDNARVCKVHKNLYNYDGIELLPFSRRFTKSQVEEMLNLKTHVSENTSIDFNNLLNIDENVLNYWTGRTITEFLNMLSLVPTLKETCKKPQLALGLYLMKLRTGDSYRRLSTLFGISESSVSRLINKARSALTAEFVPRNLGFDRLNRFNTLERNMIIPRGLFGDPFNETMIGIFDGTYVYIQKSSNYSFQKKSYSLHKHRNLVKPFIAVATDGHILDVFGPYAATKSDADIMKDLFQNEGDLMRFFRPNDAFILDRGFRDVIPFLTSLNYKVYKPESLQEGEVQLSTIDANKSRCVTLCRWVVEVVNGRFKRDYKIFRQEYFNTASTHLMDDFRIAAAIINAYHPVIVDRHDAQLILNRALRFLNTPNYLSAYVIENNLNRRRAQFERIDGNLPEIVFPQMTKDDLILFGLGIYQLKQARSYFGEHIRENGRFTIEIASNVETENVPELSSLHCTKLIRGRIKSRHHSGKTYYTYLLITDGGSWETSICGYYCSCVCGKRTVGCCAHVMTIVWYMGWARHQTVLPPASFLDDIIIREDIENE